MHYHPHSNGQPGLATLRTTHDYPLSARPPAQAMELSTRTSLHGQSSLPTTGERLGLAEGSMGPMSTGQMYMALPSTPMLQGQQYAVGQRLEIPAAVAAPSSSRNYMANSSAYVQARGISSAHHLPGQHAHPSVHRTNDPEGLEQYTDLLLSEDTDAHAHDKAVAGLGRRVQGHTRFCRAPVGGRHFIATSALHI